MEKKKKRKSFDQEGEELFKVRLSGASLWPSISSIKLTANCHCWPAAHADKAALKVTTLARNECLTRLPHTTSRPSCQRATRAQHVTKAFSSTTSILSEALRAKAFCQLAAWEKALRLRVFKATFKFPPLLWYAITSDWGLSRLLWLQHTPALSWSRGLSKTSH